MAAPHIKPSHEGRFHAWLGKKAGEPITDADIERGLKAGGHAAQMANFAKNARHFRHGKGKTKKPERRGEPGRAERMYNRPPVAASPTKRNGKAVE